MLSKPLYLIVTKKRGGITQMKKVKKLQGKICRIMNEAHFFPQRDKVLRIHQLTFGVDGEEDSCRVRLYHTEGLSGYFDDENLGKPVEFTLDDFGNVTQYSFIVKPCGTTVQKIDGKWRVVLPDGTITKRQYNTQESAIRSLGRIPKAARK